MSDEEIERGNECCVYGQEHPNCNDCPYKDVSDCYVQLPKDLASLIIRLKSAKQTAETQLKELLSALYKRTDSEQGFTLYRKDIVELAKDYGIKEEELNGKSN